jgi:hypothetical protein
VTCTRLNIVGQRSWAAPIKSGQKDDGGEDQKAARHNARYQTVTSQNLTIIGELLYYSDCLYPPTHPEEGSYICAGIEAAVV